VYTDRVSTCSDYVWYTGENLNANSALHVGYSVLHLCCATHQSAPAVTGRLRSLQLYKCCCI
jgi:hypothetical protein